MHELGPDIWRIDGPDVRQPGGVRFPIASTVIRLPDRSLVVYSPIAFDAAQAAGIDGLGDVAHVVVPSLLHHLFARAAVERWPRATVQAAPGIAAKQPELRVDRTLGDDTEPAWRDAVDAELVAGAPKIAETVLFHRASRTLVCADLMFHIQPANFMTRTVLSLVSGLRAGELGQSRIWRFAVRDRDAARSSIDRILAWPIAQIATAHGEPCPITSPELAARMTRIYRGRPTASPTAAPA